MTAAAVTTITDFVLAGEVLVLAGILAKTPKQRFSAAWFWSWVMLLMGTGALIGGIDHGWFESGGRSRYAIERLNWIVLGAMTFCLLMAAARQFFSPRIQRAFAVLGLLQFAANTVLALVVDSFLVVILNYVPVMLLMLVLNSLGLRNGTGSVQMIAGLLILAGASGVQAAGVDRFSPLDHNGLYHVIAMIGVVYLYLAAPALKRK